MVGSDLARLIAAFRADPNDETGRLALADYIEEHAPELAHQLHRWNAGILKPGEWNRQFLPHYFGKFPHADFHADMADAVDSLHTRRGTKQSCIAPRGGAKSTWWTLAYALRAGLEGWEPYTLILSDSSAQANQHLGHIRKELEENADLAAVYRDETGIGPEWNESRIRLRNGSLIEALGTGKKVRGRRNRSARPSLIIFDDIQSNEDVVSAVNRERDWNWATREVIPAGDERTNFLGVGSAIHREAVAVRLGNLPGWSGKTHRAVRQWPTHMKLWVEFERLATNLADDKRLQTALAYYAEHKAEMDAGAKVYWPERWPLVDLMLQRATVGASAFESEYQGVPGSIEGAEWPAEVFDRPDWFFEQWPADLVFKIQSLDPSKGASDKSDFQAHVLLGLSRYGTLYADCELRREPEWVERAINIAEGWKPAELIAEGNNTMGLMLPAAQRVLAERRAQKRWAALTYRETLVTRPKPVRIRVLNDYLRRGQLRVRNTVGGRMLTDQLRDFPYGDHDDGPDALATAVSRLQELVK